MILPGHIRDAHGRILVRAGQLLTRRTLATLSRQVLTVGADWPEGFPARTIAAAKAVRGGDTHVLDGLKYERRRRRHKRHPLNAQIQIRVIELAGWSARDRDIAVHVFDISSGGMGFDYDQYIPVGARIEVVLKWLQTDARIIGVVRHCRCVDGRTHRIGVKFIAREPSS